MSSGARYGEEDERTRFREGPAWSSSGVTMICSGEDVGMMPDGEEEEGVRLAERKGIRGLVKIGARRLGARG